jgi:ABC-2 type transport system ATP-binding protein
MIEAINLTKSFQNLVALDSLNLKIEAGEIYCLLGANGAGKSTTINIFLNFIEPTSGTALIKGIDVTRSPLEARRILGYIPESVMLYRNLTGLENLRYFTALANRQDYAEAELRELLIEVGLPPEAASRTRVSSPTPISSRSISNICIEAPRSASPVALTSATSAISGTSGGTRGFGRVIPIVIVHRTALCLSGQLRQPR